MRMRGAAQFKDASEWTIGVRRAIWGGTYWSRPLCNISLWTTMSKPKFQTDLEEIEEEYQQLQVIKHRYNERIICWL